MCSCPTGVLFSAAKPKKAKIDGAGVSSIQDLEAAIQRTLMLPHTLALLLYDDDFSEWMQPTKLEEVPRKGKVQLEAKDDSLQAPTPLLREMRETQSIAQPAAVQLRETISDADDLGPLTFESDPAGGGGVRSRRALPAAAGDGGAAAAGEKGVVITGGDFDRSAVVHVIAEGVVVENVAVHSFTEFNCAVLMRMGSATVKDCDLRGQVHVFEDTEVHSARLRLDRRDRTRHWGRPGLHRRGQPVD